MAAPDRQAHQLGIRREERSRAWGRGAGGVLSIVKNKRVKCNLLIIDLYLIEVII